MQDSRIEKLFKGGDNEIKRHSSHFCSRARSFYFSKRSAGLSSINVRRSVAELHRLPQRTEPFFFSTELRSVSS
jgi:hypothetical protein